MGIVFAEREPHGAGPVILLLFLALGVCGYLLARRWPRTAWPALALLLALAFWPLSRLMEWFIRDALGPAQYMAHVHVMAAVEATVILVTLALPLLGARGRRSAVHTASRLTTR